MARVPQSGKYCYEHPKVIRRIPVVFAAHGKSGVMDAGEDYKFIAIETGSEYIADSSSAGGMILNTFNAPNATCADEVDITAVVAIYKGTYSDGSTEYKNYGESLAVVEASGHYNLDAEAMDGVRFLMVSPDENQTPAGTTTVWLVAKFMG